MANWLNEIGMTRQQYADNQKLILNRMQKKFVGSIYRALKAQNSSFSNDLRENGIDYAESRLTVNILNDKLVPIIRALHVQAGLFTAKRVRRGLKLKNHQRKAYSLRFKRAGFGFNEQVVADIQEYFRLHLLEKAVLPISRTTIERIRTILNKAQEEGWGVDRILDEMKGAEFQDMTRRRARSIVRTETVRASNYGAMSGAYNNDYETIKVWIAVKDFRTRRTHTHYAGVGGEKRDLLKPFSNGLMFPGDPNGPAKEVCECRCCVAFEPKRDAQGQIIWKPEPAMSSGFAIRQSLANALALGIGILINELINE